MVSLVAPGRPAVQVRMFDFRPVLEAARATAEGYVAEMHERGVYILGPRTAAFERDFAEAVGGGEAIGVGSGTGALELCLRDAGLAETGCDVIVPAMTSMFTAHAVVAAGARVRLADVSPERLLLTPEALLRAWTPATRAVVAVHLYGQPCAIDEIAAICRERGAALIQDACQAHGARYRGAPLTDFSPYCAYSFYPTKNLGGLGDGGAVVTSDPEVAERLRAARDGGRLGGQVCWAPGVNSRLDELQACYLHALLPNLTDWNEHRRAVAAVYRRALADSAAVRLLDSDEDSVHHLAVARCARRDELREFLADRGVETGVHYPAALHEHPGLAEKASFAAPPSEAARGGAEVVSLPIGPHVSLQDAAAVAGAVAEFAR